MAIRADYKPIVRAKRGDLRGAMMVGTNSAIIGWNIDKDKRPNDLMGFAVRRTEYDPETREVLRIGWLNGQKRFATGDDDTGADVRSDQAPFQRFRWSDYTIKAGSSYRYDVYPMLGRPGDLERGDPLTFNVRPSDYVEDGVGIYANRGVTAAMAYLDRFKGRHPEDVPDGSA